MISHNADAIGDTKSVESTLSRLPAYRTEYESSLLGTPKIEIWTKHDGQIFLIEYKSDADDYNTGLPILQKMVDSFHFTR